MAMISSLFSNSKPIIGMIHVAALPGARANTLPMSEIIAKAIREVATCRDCGVYGVIIENMHTRLTCAAQSGRRSSRLWPSSPPPSKSKAACPRAFK